MKEPYSSINLNLFDKSIQYSYIITPFQGMKLDNIMAINFAIYPFMTMEPNAF